MLGILEIDNWKKKLQLILISSKLWKFEIKYFLIFYATKQN